MNGKQTYTFNGHTDYWRRFGSKAKALEPRNGKTVWAWRGGFWTITEHGGASTWYTAQRITELGNYLAEEN